MKIRLFPHTVLILFLLFQAGVLRASGQGQVLLPQISPAVLEDTAGGRSADFLVVLRASGQDAAARAGSLSGSWQARGSAVHAALQRAAGTSQPAVTAALRAAGGQVRASFTVVNALAVRGTRRTVAALAARPDVLSLLPDRPFRVALESASAPLPVQSADSTEWGIQAIGADNLWALGVDGTGMVYANADTGVEWEHEALKSHYRGWDGAAASHAYNWWDAIHEDISPSGAETCGLDSPFPCDDNGHGTHTTGTAVGGTASQHIGVAPGATWVACRNMDDGWGKPSTYIECLDFFLAPWDANKSSPDPAKRPHVVSNSYSCTVSEGCTDATPLLQAAAANLSSAGVFMSVSAGNSGSACSTVNTPPAVYAESFTVGSVDSSLNIAASSSRGPVTLDGSNRLKPDIAAPGVGVRSSIPGGYGFKSGTSMAAPHVAGAVALLWQAFPALRGEVSATRSLLQSSAVPKTTTQGCGGDTSDSVPNHVYGYGVLDAFQAYLDQGGPPPEPTPEPDPLYFYLPYVHRQAGT